MTSLPITVKTTVQSNLKSYNLKKQNIPMYEMRIKMPAVVKLTVDTSKRVYAIAAESDTEDIELSSSMAIVIEGSSDIPYYNGDYVVNPKAKSEIILETKNKRCRENITVNKIQTSQTHNIYGTTFYIAEVT